jgi:putative membrane protein (TIGR04086 family)
VKYSGVSVGVIMPATQVIKALSIFFGVLIAIRSFEKRAFINGGILGIVYTAVAFLALSVIDKSFSPIEGLFAEIVFAAVVGALSSMLLRLRKSNV